MPRSMNTLSEIAHAPKHAFRQAEHRPGKAQQRRYERRKIREYLKLHDWQEQDG